MCHPVQVEAGVFSRRHVEKLPEVRFLQDKIQVYGVTWLGSAEEGKQLVNGKVELVVDQPKWCPHWWCEAERAIVRQLDAH